MDNSMNQEMKPYYVYELRDPRSNAVFYVGKGKDQRGKQHVLEALNTSAETEKLNLIRNIHDAGEEVKVIVIGRYDSEQEALAVESTLIKWVYGFKSLTNMVHGHGHRSIRALGDLEVIRGIDIPRKDYTRNGEYKESVLRDVRQNYVMEDLETLRDKLLAQTPDLQITEPQIMSTQDPSIVVTYNDHIRIQLILSRSGKQTVVMNLLPSEWRAEAQHEFIQICRKIGLEPKANGKYAKPDDWKASKPHINDLEVIAGRLKAIKGQLESVGEQAAY